MAQTMGPAMTAAALGVDWSRTDFPKVHVVDLGDDKRNHQYGENL